MPHRKDLSPWKQQIERWIEEKMPIDNMRSQLALTGIRVGRTVFKEHLNAWGLQLEAALRPHFQDSQALRDRLQHCFRELRASDKETVRILEAEGFVIGIRRVARLRKEMGLMKRLEGNNAIAMEAAATEALQNELDSGHVEDFGRGHLYTYMRSKYQIVGR